MFIGLKLIEAMRNNKMRNNKENHKADLTSQYYLDISGR
ncbi:hypothetical protein NOC27_2949 [Nitrosococcus oceani AFC27]|nr:hypothetical protein NOC27_2949 [Nitrosococcus oceani AFC27]